MLSFLSDPKMNLLRAGDGFLLDLSQETPAAALELIRSLTPFNAKLTTTRVKP